MMTLHRALVGRKVAGWDARKGTRGKIGWTEVYSYLEGCLIMIIKDGGDWCEVRLRGPAKYLEMKGEGE